MKNSKQKKKRRYASKAAGSLSTESTSLGKKKAESIELPGTLSGADDTNLNGEKSLLSDSLSQVRQCSKSMGMNASGPKTKWQKDLPRNGFTSRRGALPKNYHR